MPFVAAAFHREVKQSRLLFEFVDEHAEIPRTPYLTLFIDTYTASAALASYVPYSSHPRSIYQLPKPSSLVGPV